MMAPQKREAQNAHPAETRKKKKPRRHASMSNVQAVKARSRKGEGLGNSSADERNVLADEHGFGDEVKGTLVSTQASVPVVVVTSTEQLPAELRRRKGGQPLVVGFDCEGVGLSREGRLCVMQLALNGTVYLVDAVAGGPILMEACKPCLESTRIVKVIHDCRRDGEALFFQFGIKLQGVFDTQVAHGLISGGAAGEDGISFVRLLALSQYCGEAYEEKYAVRQKLIEDPQFWIQRPWTPLMLRAAADDVRHLPLVHTRMLGLLSRPQLRGVSVRSALRARSFCCVSAADALEWPRPVPFPTLPAGWSSSAPEQARDAGSEGEHVGNQQEVGELDSQEADTSDLEFAQHLQKLQQPHNPASRETGRRGRVGTQKTDPRHQASPGARPKQTPPPAQHLGSPGQGQTHREDVGEEGRQGDDEGEGSEDVELGVVDVPPGKMGRVIGKQGCSIKAIREACQGVDIFTGSQKGPLDKVFVIGAKKQVLKAQALIRGRFS